MTDLLATGLYLIDRGAPIIPVGSDKDPKGVIVWRKGEQDYVTRAMTADQWERDWAHNPKVHGVAVLGSERYRTLVFDFESEGMDEPMIQATISWFETHYPRCLQRTLSGAYHAYCIITEGEYPSGDDVGKLAYRPPAPGKTDPVLLTEIRAHGQYAVIVGPGRPPLPVDFEFARITRDEYDRLAGMVREAGTYRPQRPQRRAYAGADGSGGGTGSIVSDAVAQGALSPLAVLPEGWDVTGTDHEGRIYVRRPGAKSDTSGNLLGSSMVIHSSAVEWAEPGEAMTPAETLSRSMFEGDFRRAMNHVEDMAYALVDDGEQPESEHWAEATDVLEAVRAGLPDRMGSYGTIGRPPERMFGVQAAYATLDDSTLADRFLDEHASRIRYVTRTQQFSVYDARTGLWSDAWRANATGEARFDRLLKHALQRYGREAAERVEAAMLAAAGPNPDDDDRRRAREEAKKVETHMRSTNKRANVSKAARSEASGLAGMAVESEEFDAKPFLLADPLGVIDLRTGRRQGFDPSLLLTRALPVAYDPDATCPEFECFLKEAQPNVTEREYLQRREGSTLIGRQLEHVFHVDLGEGRNGKGVLNEVVTNALGSLGGVAPSTLLMVSRNDRHEEEIARLRGLRRVWIDEARDARSLDAARVKNMSGGTRRSARFMRGNSFEYEPSDTIILSTNQLPRFEGSDGAFVARLRILPWEVSFLGREDLGLGQRIVDNEAAGVVRWLVDGVMEYLRHGLAAPPSVLMATEKAAAEADTVLAWVSAALEVNSQGRETNEDLYKAYRAWMADFYPREYVMDSPRFGRDLKKALDSVAVPLSASQGKWKGDDNRQKRGYKGLSLIRGTVNPFRGTVEGQQLGTDNDPF